jgi:hypothetical protein
LLNIVTTVVFWLNLKLLKGYLNYCNMLVALSFNVLELY